MCAESKLNTNSPESNGIKSLKNKSLKNKNNDDLINHQDETHGKSKDDIGTGILKIEICGDSHLNNINPKGLSVNGNITGSTTDDLKCHIIPTINKKRDVIIMHSGCNDLTSDVDTINNYQAIINKIKKKSAHSKIAISSLFIRKDKPAMEQKVKSLNKKS